MKTAYTRNFDRFTWGSYISAVELNSLKSALLDFGPLTPLQIALINFRIKRLAQSAAKAPKYKTAV